MKCQNPPQAYLDKARDLEKYSSLLFLIVSYTTAAILYCALIAVIFIALAYGGAIAASALVVTVFVILAVVPASMIAFAWLLRPRDPISSLIASLTTNLRTPIKLPADPCDFKTWLVDGSTLCVNMVFYYPVKNHTEEVRDRLYSCVHSTLTQDFAARRTAPDPQEVERAIEHSMESLADECGIPVLYSEVHEIHSQPSEDKYEYPKATNWG